MLFEQAQGFAHDFACGTIPPALDFLLTNSSSCGMRSGLAEQLSRLCFFF